MRAGRSRRGRLRLGDASVAVFPMRTVREHETALQRNPADTDAFVALRKAYRQAQKHDKLVTLYETRAQAIQPSVLLHLDAERVRSLSQRRPELSQALIDELVSRLRSAFRALAASAFMPVRARVARDLLERAKMSGPVVAGLHLAVTQQSLADATGSVREVVARALRELRREGAIATADDGITVVDPDALTRLAVV